MFAKLRNHENSLGENFALCFPGKLSEELVRTSANVHWLGPVKLSNPWSVWSARARLRKLLREKEFDLVICHAMWPHLVFGPVIRRAGLPLVVWAHDTPVHLHWIDRIGMRVKPDLVIANSAYTKEHWNRNYPQVLCKVGYYPIPRPESDDHAVVRQRLRKENGTSEKTNVILIASRFEAWKGHSLLFDSLSSLKDRDDWQCWIAGGAQRDHEKDMIVNLKRTAEVNGISDRIRWLGSRSDVFDLMLAADIYCQPNLAPEPFGVVFLEAMHAKLAIVTANTGGPREFLDDSCGVLVDQANEAQLTQALSRLLDDPERRSHLGTAAEKRVGQMFGIDSNLATLNDMLGELIDDFRDRKK